MIIEYIEMGEGGAACVQRNQFRHRASASHVEVDLGASSCTTKSELTGGDWSKVQEDEANIARMPVLEEVGFPRFESPRAHVQFNGACHPGTGGGLRILARRKKARKGTTGVEGKEEKVKAKRLEDFGGSRFASSRARVQFNGKCHPGTGGDFWILRRPEESRSNAHSLPPRIDLKVLSLRMRL